MDFSSFLTYLPKITELELPGESSHEKMAPLERRGLMKNIDFDIVKPRRAAVMMLFYPKNNKPHLVLIVRNSYPGVHSSQIAFPGGKVETFDESLQQTALRETFEEVGIASEQIHVIRQFSDVYIPPSNFMVFPFLGYCETELTFIPDPAEVAGIIELPLSDFFDDSNIIVKRMATSYTNDIDVPSFNVGEHIVWGATAMMLSELKDVLKMVL